MCLDIFPGRIPGPRDGPMALTRCQSVMFNDIDNMRRIGAANRRMGSAYPDLSG